MVDFDYKEAFKCNLGILTEQEQEKLREFRVAIPGMGSVGGEHLITFARAGLERFNIADFDNFELKNFNRQSGANMKTLGRSKVEVMKEVVLCINPNCDIKLYDKGINNECLENFLEGVDISLDGLDAYEVEIRRNFINKSLEKDIPVISAGPIGFGSAYLIFKPGGPNFDEYFCINENDSYNKKLAAFFVGTVQSNLAKNYMKPGLRERKSTSIRAGTNICSSVALANAIKILFNKGDVKAIPYCNQFDPYVNKYVSKKILFGNRYNPLQILKRKVLEDIFEGKESLIERYFLRDK